MSEESNENALAYVTDELEILEGSIKESETLLDNTNPIDVYSLSVKIIELFEKEKANPNAALLAVLEIYAEFSKKIFKYPFTSGHSIFYTRFDLIEEFQDAVLRDKSGDN